MSLSPNSLNRRSTHYQLSLSLVFFLFLSFRLPPLRILDVSLGVFLAAAAAAALTVAVVFPQIDFEFRLISLSLVLSLSFPCSLFLDDVLVSFSSTTATVAATSAKQQQKSLCCTRFLPGCADAVVAVVAACLLHFTHF